MLAQNSIIPLFPLNTVLFPGMMLPLHIFEERYKTMIKGCLAELQPFGVVLAKSTPALTPNAVNVYVEDLYPIGTTARITAIEHLDDGRMNLISIGQDRFIIREVETGQGNFLLGRVDPFPLEIDTSLEVDKLSQKLRPMVQQYIDHLASASGEDISGAILPTDLTALAFLAGTAVQGPLPDKQKLLSLKSLRELIKATVSVLDKEDKILAYMLKAYETHRRVQRLPFVDYSLN